MMTCINVAEFEKCCNFYPKNLNYLCVSSNTIFRPVLRMSVFFVLNYSAEYGVNASKNTKNLILTYSKLPNAEIVGFKKTC